MSHPPVTVIIPTYNLSGALRYTIKSALSQTFVEFELLVIGDACTDDTEDVVKGFDDSRVQWINLPERCGSQSGPNNAGLARARGEYVAYLGHDDLWWPTHLETGLRVLRTGDADMSVAVAIINGPRASRFKGATGLFPNDVYTPRYDFTPSSMIHTRALAERAGGWRLPKDAEIGVDHDFVTRCYRVGGRIVATREPTVFKCNTSFRRNAYRTRSFEDQAELYERMQTGGEHFRRAELVTLVQRFLEDRFFRIEGVWDEAEREKVDSAQRAAQFMRFKGATRPATDQPVLGPGQVRFSLGDDFGGFEWHLPELDRVHGHFRWSGPSTESMIALPFTLESPCTVAIHIILAIQPDVLETIAVEVNGRAVASTLEPSQTGTWLLRFGFEPAPGERQFDVLLRVPRTVRPFDISSSMDRRWLGVAVNWIEVRSAATSPSRPGNCAG